MGTYVLALWLRAQRRVKVGRLGETDFAAGWYLYVGSAFGPGGLPARLARHRRRLGADKRAHWHVDYLREQAAWGGAWARAGEPSFECAWAAELGRLPEAGIVARGFGASDCRCAAHLVHLPALPDDAWFAASLGAERLVVDSELLDDLLLALAAEEASPEGEDSPGGKASPPGEGVYETKEVAAKAIGDFGADVLEPLAAMLTGGQTDDRWWAARALAQVGVPGAVAPLSGALTDVDAEVRACAALALGHLGVAEAAPALAACLADESAFVAGVAGDALSMIGEGAVAALSGMLDDERARARLLAVQALGRIGSQQAIAALFEALQDPSYLVSFYAREALDTLGVGMVFVSP